MTDVQAFLDTTPEDVVEPKNLPVGEFAFAITSYKVDKFNNDKQTPYVDFFVKAIEVYDADEEVDLDQPWKKIPYRFFMSDAALPQLKRFFTNGLRLDGTKTWRELFEEAIGLEFRATTKQEFVGKNKDILVTNIDRVIAE